MPLLVAMMLEVLGHIGPLLLIGFPSNMYTLWVAYSLFVSWYVVVARLRFEQIYFSDVNIQKLDYLFFMKGIVFMMITTFIIIYGRSYNRLRG